MDLPAEERELQDLRPPEEEVEDYGDDYETPLTWLEDFDRFLTEGPRQFFGVDPVAHPYEVVHARSAKQYKVKQEILFKLFGETFSCSFGDEQTFFLNKVKLVAEDIGLNQFVKYLRPTKVRGINLLVTFKSLFRMEKQRKTPFQTPLWDVIGTT